MNQPGASHKLQKPSTPDVKLLKRSELESFFDIVDFLKSSKIQISPANYLKLNPK